jgi:hypothetical protein
MDVLFITINSFPMNSLYSVVRHQRTTEREQSLTLSLAGEKAFRVAVVAKTEFTLLYFLKALMSAFNGQNRE